MFFRILILQFLLTLVPPVIIDMLWLRKKRTSALSRRKNTLRRILLWTPFVALLSTGLWLMLSAGYTPQKAQIMGIYLIIILSIGISSFIFSIFALVSRIFRKSIIRNSILAIGTIISLILFSIVMTGYYTGCKKLKIKETEIVLDHLPESFNGYRIVQFSDLHLGTYGNDTTYVQQMVNTINDQKPNLIAFTGDLISYNVCELKPFISHLGKLHATDGVYAVMGNHDYMIYRHWENRRQQVESIRQLQEDERSMGWNLLLNQNAIIRHGNDSIAVIGSENHGKPPFPQLGNLKKAQKGIPDSRQKDGGESTFIKILLSHDPTHWRRQVLPETDIQLTLSGHTHGTQLSLFGWSPAQLLYKEWGGLYCEDGRYLYVSTGIGQVLIPFRFGIYPQIEILTLRTKSGN